MEIRNKSSVGFVGRRAIATASIMTGAVLVLASCGGDEGTSSTTSTTAPTAPAVTASTAPAQAPSTDVIPPVGATWLRTAEAGDLGTIVVDSSGRTVYVSQGDTPSESTCYGSCADTWLPLLTSGDPAGGLGIDVIKVGTITRSDGSDQVTYNGHPLYRYLGDTGPGQANGQGRDLFGSTWYVLNPAGDKVE